MLYLYLGTDRERARAKMNAEIAKARGDALRITDVHTVDDLQAALRGGGMFIERRVLVFENVFNNEEMGAILLAALPALAASSEKTYVFEEKPLADLRRKLEKHAEHVERFDAPKKERDGSIFALANALRRADKKALWVGYMRELEKGTAPEAIHGVLFWAAKDAFLKTSGKEARSRALVAELAALPHEARRRGEDLEYALERFALCV
ncbi:MAG: hypothetical protein AAB605_02600 [Patescibacteria group bacterium]